MPPPAPAESPPDPRELLLVGLLSLLVTAAAALAFFGPGIFTGRELFFTHEGFSSDFWHMNYPFRRFYADGLAEGRLPLWCPDLGTGYPLLADGQIGALYPPNLLLYSILALPLALNLEIVLHLILAGAFAGMFARQLGAGRRGAALSAIVYGFCGFLVVHLKHANMLVAAAWFPLVLLLLTRYASSRRAGTLALLALVVGMTALGGHPQIVYNNLLLAAFWTLPLLARTLRRPRAEGGGVRSAGRLAGGVALAIVLGLALASPQLLPTWELKGVGPRKEGLSGGDATRWGYRFRDLAGFVLPQAVGDPGRLEEVPVLDPVTGRPRVEPRTGEPLVAIEAVNGDVIFWEVTGYVGLLPLLLALFAPFLGARRRTILALAGLLLLSLGLVLGRQAGLYTIFRAVVPGFDLFRFPGRFLLYADLALALLAGIGLTALLRRLPSGWSFRKRAVAAAVVVVALLDLVHAFGDHNPRVDAEEWLRPPATVERIREDAPEGVPFRVLTVDPDRWVFRSAYRAARGWRGDLEPYRAAFHSFDPNLGLLWGINGATLHVPLSIQWADELSHLLFLAPERAGGLTRGVDPLVAALLDIRYFIDPFDVLEGLPDPILEVPGGTFVRAGPHPANGPEFTIRLYRNPVALPRAFLVPRARFASDEGSTPDEPSPAIRAMRDRRFDPRREVVISTGDPIDETGPTEPMDAPVEILEYGPHRVRLRADAPHDAWLYLSDTYYPGWTATLDGKEVEIRRANLAGRAIRFPAGLHEVIFEYRPVPFHRGLRLATLSLLCLFGLVVLRRRLKPFCRPERDEEDPDAP